MQVFKLFIKLLSRHRGMVILYTAVFLGISFSVTQSAKNNDISQGYENSSCKFAVFDNDDSELSRNFIDFLKKKNKLITIKDYEDETVKDELFNRNVDCVINIQEGFGQSLKENNIGKIKNYIEIDSISETNASSVITGQADSYLRMLSSYIQTGYPEEKAVELTKDTQNIKVDTTLLDKSGNENYSELYYYFKYLAYVFVVMMIIVIGNILTKLSDREIKDRIQCSSYKFISYNKEIFLGIMATGGIICAVFTVFAFVLCRDKIFTVNGGLFLIQMLCLMVVSLSMAYFISQLARKDNVLTMIANILGLGMAFLCGIFVPMEFMGEGILKAAHLLPAYWYAWGCEKIDKFAAGNSLQEIIICLGVQLLFAVVFVAAGVIIAKLRSGGKVFAK